ncbi:uncharacterized protein LOC113466295 [Diaphorina citri]|uniref:Uncharacterized protein LOC113466295 n=1 Tax=Diaphorina citri TaxID=121845 RepID=A0A3Q0IRX5_DIACI|nr:uncharacterized protein LOC113466295 [Diaphorina citri]
MELKQSKKETIFHREKAHSGYDRLFLLRSNTIQFFQYVQAVCQYNSNYDINPIDERVFYSQIRTLRSPSAYELESKFYTSMLGRFEFYKFIKYISLNYVVPKMFLHKGTADSTEMKDNSYLKQNISLFDTMNMRYKLMSCFRGNTNDQGTVECTADSTEMKDNSYLKQNISLFDTMNMRYKLMSCFRGNTNDQGTGTWSCT